MRGGIESSSRPAEVERLKKNASEGNITPFGSVPCRRTLRGRLRHSAIARRRQIALNNTEVHYFDRIREARDLNMGCGQRNLAKTFLKLKRAKINPAASCTRNQSGQEDWLQREIYVVASTVLICIISGDATPSGVKWFPPMKLKFSLKIF